MKRFVGIALVLILILTTSSISFGAQNQEKYSDDELFKLAQNNNYINNDNIQVRKALPNEVFVTNVSEGVKVIAEDFIIITEKLPTLDKVGLTQEVEIRAVGDIVFGDTTGNEPGFRARATSILRAESKTFPSTAVGYKGTLFGGKMESMELGNSVTSMTCKYTESGAYYTSSGGQGVVGAESKTKTWTTNLFSEQTTSAIGKDRYFTASPATGMGNAATFYCTRGTGSYSFTINASIFR